MSLNINFTHFLLQMLAMGAWIGIVAVAVAAIERLVYGRIPESFDPKKDAQRIGLPG